MAKSYILVLDDIGLSPTLDEYICTTVAPQSLDRVSLIVNLYDVTSLVEWLNQVPAVDIHLNTTKTTDSGFLMWLRRVYFIIKLLISPAEKKRMVNEWKKQIDNFYKIFGRYPNGINSHEHVHWYPPLFKEVLHLATQHNIGYVRLGKKIIYNKKTIREIIYNFFITKNTETLRHTSIHTSSTLYSADNVLDSAMESTLPQGTEVILHPHYKNDIKFLQSKEVV